MRGIAASWIITGDPAEAPIEDGAVVLHEDLRIEAVGTTAALREQYPSVAFEAHRAVLLPGLVNAHTHLELSALRGRVPGGRGFVPWAEQMLDARERDQPERDTEAIDAAVSELIGCGTAALGEVSNTLAAVPALAGMPVLGRVFHEVFALRKDTGEAMLAMAQARRAELEWPDNLSYAPAPHTTYTLHPEILQQVVANARALGARTTLHLCEHAAERAFLADGGGAFAAFLRDRESTPADWEVPGKDPVRYASALGVLGPDLICIHLADARPDEIAVVAESGAKVVLCPRSNLHIELRLPPLLALLEAGIRPGLGTDSLASCASLDVLDEARALLERFPSVRPRTLLSMATRYGAEALGLSDCVGTLAPGLAPGVLAFEHGTEVPVDPERFVLSPAKPPRSLVAPPGIPQRLPEAGPEEA